MPRVDFIVTTSELFTFLCGKMYFFAPMVKPLYNKGFSGWSQLGVFLGSWGAGFLFASIAAVAIWSIMTGQGIMNMETDMMNPKYSAAVKAVQLVSTLFAFFLPAVAYGYVCYRNSWDALGFSNRFLPQAAIFGILLLLASTPIIDTLGWLNKAIPLPADKKAAFDSLEKSYEEQVKVLGDVKTMGQYVVSLIMLALLPALFEETLFRGGLQNLLTRWKNSSQVYLFITGCLILTGCTIWVDAKLAPYIVFCVLVVISLFLYRSHALTEALDLVTNNYWFPIIFTSIVFSAIHGSWYGFLPRVALGMLLGLVFYYTQNIWYNILIHFLNNAAVVTIMYMEARDPKSQAVQSIENFSFPAWAAAISAVAVVALFVLLAKKYRQPLPPEIFPQKDDPFKNTDLLA